MLRTRVKRLTSAGAALLVLGSAGSPSAAADETVLARALRPTAVSVHGGFVVWSSWSDRAGGYRLVAWDRDRGRRVLTVRPQSVPFDADVGPGRDGRPVAVYSRCRRPPTGGQSSNQLPVYVNGRGCDLYQLALTGGVERRIDKLSQRGASEVLPTVWKAGVAFARTYERRRGLDGALPHLLLGSLRSGVPSRELPGGTRGVYEPIDDDRSPPSDYYGGPGPTGLDFDGRRVAFVWNSQAETCHPGDEGDLDHLRSEVWVDTLESGQELLEQTCEDETDRFFSPALAGERLFYSRRLNNTSFNGRFRVYEFDGAAFSETPVSRKALSIARDGETTYFTRILKFEGRTEIVGSTDLDFQPSERLGIAR